MTGFDLQNNFLYLPLSFILHPRHLCQCVLGFECTFYDFSRDSGDKLTTVSMDEYQNIPEGAKLDVSVALIFGFLYGYLNFLFWFLLAAEILLKSILLVHERTGHFINIR